MINSLTEEQRTKLPQYVKEWTQKGLTTERRTIEEATNHFTDFQSVIMKRDTPTPVILLDSPLQCWVAICEINNSGFTTVESLVDKVNEIIKNATEKGTTNELMKGFIWPYFDCQFWASWLSFYEFMRVELGIVYTNMKEYDVFKRCQPYGMAFPLDEVFIVCQPFKLVNKNKSGLHCENGPALSYGHNEIYALNGVVMNKKWVMTHHSKIDVQEILKETNVEVRRELIRKVGIERVMHDLPCTLLDSKDTYELYSIELSPEIKNAKYLKMINPSIKCFHIEGVGPEVNTVEEALNWRNNNFFTNAEVLS